jgi:hypothetical protein
MVRRRDLQIKYYDEREFLWQVEPAGLEAELQLLWVSLRIGCKAFVVNRSGERTALGRELSPDLTDG